MFLITNPYTLFVRLKDEFLDRLNRDLLPAGKFSLKFDLSGKFPGGVIINTKTDNSSCEISIAKTEEDFIALKNGFIPRSIFLFDLAAIQRNDNSNKS